MTDLANVFTGAVDTPASKPRSWGDKLSNVATYAGNIMAKYANELAPGITQSLSHPKTVGEVAQGFIPPDPYKVSGDAVSQWQNGDKLGAAETMMGGMPQTGVIIGGKALRPSQVALARQLELEGKNPDRIRQETNLWRGPDASLVDPNAAGPWREEVSDTGLRLNIDPRSHDARRGMALTDFLSHSDLIDRVPQMSGLQVRSKPDSSVGAYFMPPNMNREMPQGGVVLGPKALRLNDRELRGAIAHELNHASDYFLGLPDGGNPALIGSRDFQEMLAHRSRVYRPGSALGKLHESLRAANEMEARDRYFRLAGEQQAYATEDRVDLSQESRSASPITDVSSGYGYSNPVSEHIPVPQNFWRRVIEEETGVPMESDYLP